MNVIDIKEIPQVAIDVMNATHQEEVVLINTIGELVSNTQPELSDKSNVDPISEQAITKKLMEWLEHTRTHFGHEEKMMEEYGFPAYVVHSSAHEVALSNLEQVVKNWQQSKNLEPLSEYLFETWPAWFQQHVQTMDFMTAQFLSMKMR